jgi:hypothetical protein
MRPTRSARPSYAALAALAVLLATAVPAAATGSSGPTYRAVVAPADAAAGTAPTFTVTLTQLVNSEDRKLGSVRITPPAGLVLTGASAVKGITNLPVTIAAGAVTINNVDLKHAGKTAVVTIQTTIGCGVQGTKSWAVKAHNTAGYTSVHAKVLVRHPSSQLTTNVTGCSLAFAGSRQPSAAEIGQTITSVAGNPAGLAIAVQLRDGNGAPANQSGVNVSLAIVADTGTPGAILGGTTAGLTNGSGLAEFAPTIDTIGQDYQLRATAGSGISSATSLPFDIDAVVEICAGACSGTDQQGDTTATVSAKSNGGLLTMSLGLDPAPDCNNAANGFYVGTSEVLTFSVTPATGRTTVVMKLARASVTKPVFKYEVCFESPDSEFVNKLGEQIGFGEAGILPWCSNILHPSGGPCVVLKWFDLHGNIYVKFSVPVGDPRGQF